MTADLWPIERIRGLKKADVQNLRANALARGFDVIVQRCDEVLQTGVGTTSNISRSTKMHIEDSAAADIAELFLALPKVMDVVNARRRLEILANPVSTFSGLWRHYINCGFSSQEKSDPNTPLGRFSVSNSPLLELQTVIDRGEDSAWVLSQLAAAGLNRMTQKKVELLASARKAFVSSKGHDDSLANGRIGGGLDVFLDLANGRVSDRAIATSALFSASIDEGHLYGIGHKQIRNILVNTGLAHNVLPIDSRWRGYVGSRLPFESTDLSNRSRYLALEDVLRKALMLAQERRDDIPSLAVLDSVVFAVQSADGPGGEGWNGG